MKIPNDCEWNKAIELIRKECKDYVKKYKGSFIRFEYETERDYARYYIHIAWNEKMKKDKKLRFVAQADIVDLDQRLRGNRIHCWIGFKNYKDDNVRPLYLTGSKVEFIEE
jgi:hypothetical protein